MVRKDQPFAVFNGKPIRKLDFEFWIGLGADYFSFCLLSFPQNERKIQKLRQL